MSPPFLATSRARLSHGSPWLPRAWWLVAALLLVAPTWAADDALQRLLHIESQLLDDPETLLREARTAHAQAPPESDAAWSARLREAAAAGALELDDQVTRMLPALEQQALARNDAAAQCLADTLRIHADYRAVGLAAAERHAARAMARTRQAGQSWCEARLLQARGDVFITHGWMSQGTADAQAALAYFERAGEVVQRVVALADICWVYKRDTENPGSLAEAIKAGQEAERQVDAPRQRYLASIVHHNLAGAYQAAGQRADARHHAMLSRGYSEVLGDTLGQAYADRLLGRIELDEGRPDAALRRFDQAAPVFDKGGIDELVLVARLGSAEALLKLGRIGEMRQLLGSLTRLRAQVTHLDLDIEYHRLRLDLAVLQRDAAEAADAARDYANAIRTRERDLNRKSAAELRERFRAERTDAENQHLREQQQVVESRQSWLLASLALAIALVVTLAAFMRQQHRQRQRLRSLAETDELTQLPNRRSILALVDTAAHSRRAGCHPLCLALLDVDHFKRVNDAFGHEVGDTALQAFARACRAALRSSDSVGRLGGEEFLLVLPGTPVAEAAVVFDRLRAQLQATPVSGMPDTARLRCSMGIIEMRPGLAVDAALRMADAALYRAKAAGRDRFEVAVHSD